MPKAAITLPTGAQVTIDGTMEEIQTILDLYAERGKKGGRRGPATRTGGRAGAKRSLKGPIGYILELKEEGFFKAKRSLKEVKDKLSERGHIYPPTSLSPALIRLARRRELGRLKERGVWFYVTRQRAAAEA